MGERVFRVMIQGYRKWKQMGGFAGVHGALQQEVPWKPTQFDIALCFGLMVFIPALNLLLTRLIFKPLGRHLVLDKKLLKLRRLPGKDQVKLNKFVESAWKFLYYSCMTSYAYYAVSDEPFFRDTSHSWHGYPQATFKLELKLLYLIQLANYLQGVFYLLLVETRRKDFLVMLAHHVVTITLIGFSWYCNYVRIGSMVLMLHDPADIFLEGAKLNNYARNELASTVLFVGLLVVWAATRLVYFPFVVIRSTLFESIEIVKDGVLIHWELFNALLISLVLMHIYWFYLMLRIAARKVFSGKMQDSREADDDSDDD